MHWGYRIMIAYIAGVAFLLFFVIGSMLTRTEMVEDNYYEKELGFNQRIKDRTNADLAGERILIAREGDSVTVQLDSSLAKQLHNGLLDAYYAAGEQADRHFVIPASPYGRYAFPVAVFHKGSYIFRLSFTRGTKSYYKEKNIFF